MRTSWLSALFLAACSDASVTARNTAPEAVISYPSDGAALAEGEAVVLRGWASDDDDGSTELEATWLVDAEEACGPVVPQDGATSCEVVLAAGGARIELVVRDPRGATGTAAVDVTVAPTGDPGVAVLSPEDGAHLIAGDLVAFEAEVDDPEDPPEDLVVAWSSDATPLSLDVTVDPSGIASAWGVLPEGSHVLTVTVTDTSGKTGSDSVAVTVGPPNGAPDCAIVAPADGSFGPLGTEVVFSGEVGDPDQAPESLAVLWASDVDGALGTSVPDSSGTALLSTTSLSAATHRITLSVEDDLGERCSSQILYSVGTPPTLVVTEPADGAVVDEGSAVSFAAIVGDAEDGAALIEVRWESDLDGELAVLFADGAGQVGHTTSSLSRGTHLVAVTATDPDGLYAEENRVLVVNGVPTAPGVRVDPDPATSSDDLTAVVVAASVDPEGAALTYRFAWTRDGVASGHTGATVPAADTRKGQLWAVQVSAFDGLAVGPAGGADALVGNSPPAIDDIALDPDPARTTDTIACLVSASDPDGDPVTVSRAWAVDGVTRPESGASLSSSAFVAGQTVTCTATPSDGDAGTPAAASLVVANSPPAISGLVVTPDPLGTDSVAVVAATASDADGDPISFGYAWTVDGAVAGTGPTLDGAAWFDRGQAVAVTVTPIDASGSGAAVASGPRVVANTAPTAPGVAIVPASPEPYDNLVCGVASASVDADGDPLVYEVSWEVDGVPFAGATTTVLAGDTVPSGATASDETWICRVVPWDGYEDGAAGVASAAIGCTPSAYWFDGDGDGYGDPALSVGACPPPAGWVANPDDCDDGRSAIHPGALEVCDGVDNDCDGLADDDDPVVSPGSLGTFYEDADGDGFGDALSPVDACAAPSGYVDGDGDCDDSAADVYPGAPELCDGVDRSCDGVVDPPDALDAIPWYLDMDGDGWGTSASAVDGCDPPGPAWVDAGGDCDAADAAVFPGATEWCDGIDNDCDGVIDEAQAADASPWYADVDGDGFGDPESAIPACHEPTGWVADDTDCDDSDDGVFPGAGDLAFDGVDGDCDGLDCEAGADAGGAYFALCFDAVGWHDGRSECLFHEYDDLASVRDAGEQAFIELLVSDAGAFGSHAPWIGYADEMVEGSWGWADLAPVGYENWSPGEPNGWLAESCAELNWPLGTGGWNDADCYDAAASRRSYVCERR